MTAAVLVLARLVHPASPGSTRTVSATLRAIHRHWKSGSLLLWLAALGWAQPVSAQTGPSQLVTYEPATNTVTFALEAGAPGRSGPFNFDGYANGGATLIVPPKSTIVMNFVNQDATPHSAMIIADADPMPNMGGDPAIPGAYTKKAIEGIPQGGRDVMRFTAPASGSFRIFCAVPGHGLSGMWIRMKVDPSATMPSWITR
jgi:sulfocyanin